MIKDNYMKTFNVTYNGDTLKSFSLSSGKRKMINRNQTFSRFLSTCTVILLDNIESTLLYISAYMIRGYSLLL